MFFHYYKIKSPAVIALLEGNRRKRTDGLKKAFEFADKYGFEVGTCNDSIYASVDILVCGVPDELKKYFKRMPRGNLCPKKNSKIARGFGEQIKALKITLDSPFPLIKKETGFEADIVFDVASRCAGTPRVLSVGGDYFLQIPSLSDKPPFDAKENYEPIRKWQVQKAIDENNNKKEKK